MSTSGRTLWTWRSVLWDTGDHFFRRDIVPPATDPLRYTRLIQLVTCQMTEDQYHLVAERLGFRYEVDFRGMGENGFKAEGCPGVNEVIS